MHILSEIDIFRTIVGLMLFPFMVWVYYKKFYKMKYFNFMPATTYKVGKHAKIFKNIVGFILLALAFYVSLAVALELFDIYI